MSLGLASRTNTMTKRCPSTTTSVFWAASLALAATRSPGADDGWWSSPRCAAAAVTSVGAFLSCSALPTRGSSAGRARVLGVLLAFPQLAAAQHPGVGVPTQRPVSSPTAAPVTIFERLGLEKDSAYRDELELMEEAAAEAAREKATPGHPVRRSMTTYSYDFDDTSIRTAVAAWLSDSASAETTYGHISTWATGGVTDMSDLFCASSSSCDYYNSAAASFNEDIGA